MGRYAGGSPVSEISSIKALLGDGQYAEYIQYRYDLVQWAAVNRLTETLRDIPHRSRTNRPASSPSSFGIPC